MDLIPTELVLVTGEIPKQDSQQELQWRSQPWNMPVPAAPGSDSDSATPVL